MGFGGPVSEAVVIEIGDAWCRYADAWINQKAAWQLTIDLAERDALRNILTSC